MYTHKGQRVNTKRRSAVFLFVVQAIRREMWWYNVCMSEHTTTKRRGDFGEMLACRYLVERGFTICARNYMPRRGIKRGEIDIVAKKDGVLHFVEVKTRFVRRGALVDPPELRITREKLQALNRTALAYLRAHNHTDAEYRFDAVAIVVCSADKTARVRFLTDIFL